MPYPILSDRALLPIKAVIQGINRHAKKRNGNANMEQERKGNGGSSAASSQSGRGLGELDIHNGVDETDRGNHTFHLVD